MTAHDCAGIWCVSGDPAHPRRFRWARCSCGIAVTSLAAWATVDEDAFAQAVDPDGLQREFMQTCGLDVETPAPGRGPR